jgi:hypothetical protein
MGSYEVSWKSQKFEKPSGKDETEKTFTFTFRVDKYYTVYKALLALWQYICNSDSEALAEDVVTVIGTSNIRTDIMVHTIDTQGVTTNERFNFERAWLKSLTSISCDMTNGEPIMMGMHYVFVKMLPQF